MITNELISEIKSKINDNQKQDITGGVLQGVLVDMVNGLTTKGLTFLGVLGPNDPAPSNEPTGGYYLSFQASTKETPYFNGVHLHRYSMLIWTQNETGRWEFKRVKYEDHRGPKRVVVGRALPIHFNQDTQTFTVHLSGDGTRDTYHVGNCPLFRDTNGQFYRDGNICISKDFGARLQEMTNKYTFSFLPEDNEKVFSDKNELIDFLVTRLQDTMPFYICSSPNYVCEYDKILWRPKNPKHTIAFIRRYYGMGAYRPKEVDRYDDFGKIKSTRANARLPFRVKFVKVLDAEKLGNKLYILRGARGYKTYGDSKIYCKGFSDNYEVVIPQRSTNVGL